VSDLRTLKDVKKPAWGLEAELMSDDLRLVAREWIKELERCTLDRIPQKDGINAEDLGIGIGRFHSALQTNGEIATLQTFIRHFFNLDDGV